MLWHQYELLGLVWRLQKAGPQSLHSFPAKQTWFKSRPVSSLSLVAATPHSSTLESVRKDVECRFGILKKRWKILKYGIRFEEIEVVERVFVVCCILHNMILSEMETRDNSIPVRRGAPIGGDAI